MRTEKEFEDVLLALAFLCGAGTAAVLIEGLYRLGFFLCG